MAPKVTLRLPDDEFEHLGRIAEHRGLSVNETLRQLVAATPNGDESLQTLLARASEAIDQAKRLVDAS